MPQVKWTTATSTCSRVVRGFLSCKAPRGLERASARERALGAFHLYIDRKRRPPVRHAALCGRPPAYRRFARSTRIRSLSDRNPASVARIFRVPVLLSFTRTRAWPLEFVFRRLPAKTTLAPFIRLDLQPLQS